MTRITGHKTGLRKPCFYRGSALVPKLTLNETGGIFAKPNTLKRHNASIVFLEGAADHQN